MSEPVRCGICTTQYHAGTLGSGGLIFGFGKVLICPECAITYEPEAKRQREEHLIQGRQPSHMTFHGWITAIREKAPSFLEPLPALPSDLISGVSAPEWPTPTPLGKHALGAREE